MYWISAAERIASIEADIAKYEAEIDKAVH
jgi:hypothetical protein